MLEKRRFLMPKETCKEELSLQLGGQLFYCSVRTPPSKT